MIGDSPRRVIKRPLIEADQRAGARCRSTIASSGGIVEIRHQQADDDRRKRQRRSHRQVDMPHDQEKGHSDRDDHHRRAQPQDVAGVAERDEVRRAEQDEEDDDADKTEGKRIAHHEEERLSRSAASPRRRPRRRSTWNDTRAPPAYRSQDIGSVMVGPRLSRRHRRGATGGPAGCRRGRRGREQESPVRKSCRGPVRRRSVHA